MHTFVYDSRVLSEALPRLHKIWWEIREWLRHNCFVVERRMRKPLFKIVLMSGADGNL